ncbi:MAG TPA: PilZ domain-containing protein [Vicinamibacterales bacterium]
MSNYIVITKPEHLVSIKKRLSEADNVDVVSEADLLQYQDTLLTRPPDVLLMHSAFATTSRGATLIAALKSNPRDTGTAIRVLIEDDVTPLLITEDSLSPYDALLETSRPLDRAGTRQAARYPMNRRPVAVNGDPGQLIDLSVSGAQVQSIVRLRPLKMARLVLPDGNGDLRLQGTVAWAIAVPSGGAIQYRAGIEFVNPNQKVLAEFCERHGVTPDAKH